VRYNSAKSYSQDDGFVLRPLPLMARQHPASVHIDGFDFTFLFRYHIDSNLVLVDLVEFFFLMHTESAFI